MKRFYPLLICCLLLCACGQTNPTSPASPQEPSAQEETNANDALTQILAQYADTDHLPAFTGEYAAKTVNADKTIVLKDTIENDLEWKVYASYLYLVTEQWDDYLLLANKSGAFHDAFVNTQEDAKEGRYMTSYTIHALGTLTAKEINAVFAPDILLRDIQQNALTEYAVVSLDIDWVSNEARLAAGPQLDDGRYTRYYLLGKTADSDAWLLSEVYWEDFLTPTQTAADQVAFTIDFATDETTEHAVCYQAEEDSPYLNAVCITPAVPLDELSFVSLLWDDASANVALGETVFTAKDLSPSRPFVVKMTLPETIPAWGISFCDESGNTKVYAILQSGKDGSLLLSAIDA